MIGAHSVSAEHFAALSTGYGGPGAIGELWRGQESRRLLLLRLVVEQASGDPSTMAAVAAMVAAEERDEAARRDLTVYLEDLDPYRDIYHVAAADRLSRDESDAWRRQLAETWSILTEFVPEVRSTNCSRMSREMEVSGQRSVSCCDSAARLAVRSRVLSVGSASV